MFRLQRNCVASYHEAELSVTFWPNQHVHTYVCMSGSSRDP